MDDKALPSAETDGVSLQRVERTYIHSRSEQLMAWHADPNAVRYAEHAIATPAQETTKQSKEQTKRSLITGGVVIAAMVGIGVDPAHGTLYLLAAAIIGGEHVVMAIVSKVGDVLREKAKPSAGSEIVRRTSGEE